MDGAEPRRSALDWSITYPRYDPITWVGIGLAIFSNALISVSLNIQKYAHNENEKLGENRKPYHKIPIWWVGMIINAVGEVGNLVAYGYAEATVVTPIGAVGVIFSVIIATWVLKEPFRKIHAQGILCIIAGVCLIVYSKGTEKVIEPTVQEFLDSYFLTYQSIFYCTVVLVSTWAVYSIKEKKGKEFVIVYAGLCSLIASWTVLGCKAFMAWVRLTVEKGENQFGNFPLGFIPLLTLGMIIVCAVWSLHFLQQAMRYHDNNKVIPTYYATFTLACMIGAALVYREFEGTSVESLLLFGFGCCLAALGVFAISKGRQIAIAESVHGMAGENDRNGLVEMDELAIRSSEVEVVVDETESKGVGTPRSENGHAVQANGHADEGDAAALKAAKEGDKSKQEEGEGGGEGAANGQGKGQQSAREAEKDDLKGDGDLL